jgi:hypothetical protein
MRTALDKNCKQNQWLADASANPATPTSFPTSPATAGTDMGNETPGRRRVCDNLPSRNTDGDTK